MDAISFAAFTFSAALVLGRRVRVSRSRYALLNRLFWRLTARFHVPKKG